MRQMYPSFLLYSFEKIFNFFLGRGKNKTDNFLKGIEKGGVHRLPHGVVLTIAEDNHPKEIRKQKILDKVTRINHEEEDFRGVEVTVVAEEDLLCVLGVA
jgi:hypothetical protein